MTRHCVLPHALPSRAAPPGVDPDSRRRFTGDGGFDKSGWARVPVAELFWPRACRNKLAERRSDETEPPRALFSRADAAAPIPVFAFQKKRPARRPRPAREEKAPFKTPKRRLLRLDPAGRLEISEISARQKARSCSCRGRWKKGAFQRPANADFAAGTRMKGRKFAERAARKGA
ncbi:MAG TPA: hypothetical protein DDZ68_03175 [Parvularcula sp.]|nr:hypothetical protein [Parvularcula sp.]